MPRLDRLRIENFRGASTPFELNFGKKPLVVIFGENGTGKTTIVDALDAIGNCSGGSLKTKSSTSLKEHLATTGKKPADMRIEVETGDITYRAALKGSNVVVTPPECPPIWVLRRPSVQQFIEARPAERYKALQHLIGVEGVESSEETLKRAVDNANAQLNDGVATITAAESQLARLWEQEGRAGGDWRTWAAQEAVRDATGLLAQARRLRASREAIETALRAAAELDRAEERRQAARQLTDDIAAELAADPGVDAAGAVRLAELLDRASRHLTADPTGDACPVCRQPVAVPDLRADLAARLAELSRFRALAQRRQSADDALRSADRDLAGASDALIAAARHLLDIAANPSDTFAPLHLAPGGRSGIPPWAPSLADEETEPEIALSLATDLVAAAAALVVPLQVQEEATAHAEGRLSSIKLMVTTIETTRASLAELEGTLAGLKSAHELVRTSRIAFTQSILDDVGQDCAALYARIHPRERINVAAVVLDPAQRASIKQTVSFEGHDDVPPQAYLSEAHLDTLGFCFWLALAKREPNRAQMVLVLDDIFSSVDSQHLNRISELIVEESQHFAQVILTTHSRTWLNVFRYENRFEGRRDLVELHRWSLDRGIRSSVSPLAIDELRALVDADRFDRLAVASRAGILLESVLLRLGVQYRCKMVLKLENDYALKELLDGTTDLFKKLEVRRPIPPATDQDGRSGGPPWPPSPADPPPIEYAATPLAPQHVSLKAACFVRNQVGAHFNLEGMEISDTEVEEFGRDTIAFFDALTCDGCGRIPYKSTGTSYRCGCTSTPTELIPLQLT